MIESNVLTRPPTSIPIQNGTTEQQLYTYVPKIQCTKFGGKVIGKFEFQNFQAQFENCVTSVESPKVKLSLLKGFLTSYASQLISNLSLENKNYNVAINLLKKLVVPFIIDEIFWQILDYSLKYDPDFANVMKFLSGVNADLSEFKSSFDLELFEENSPGFELISHIIFSKLPSSFQKELIRKFDINYPKTNQISDGYNEVLKTLKRTSSKKIKKNNHNNQHQNGFKTWQGNFN